MANLWNAVLLTALAALACASPTVGDDSSLRPRADVAGAVDLSISLKDKALRNKTAPYLYGIMFEDINHSGDGGIYAELIVNRAFQGSNIVVGPAPQIEGNVITSSENPLLPGGPVITGWGAIGKGVRLSLDTLHPLSKALPTVLQVDIPLDAVGEVGIVNYGWWGMDVQPQTYNASFYVLANAPRYKSNGTTFTVSIRSNLTGEVWAKTVLPTVKVDTVEYMQLAAPIINTATAPNANNSFAITMDAEQVRGQTFYFSLVSLFPETFKNRPNGLRKDLAEAYADMRPKFLRFPGGNNLEGMSRFTRWKWRDTVGPLRDRPGRQGNWNYYNTDGLGLVEYLQWAEDMGAQVILGLYAGYSLDVFGLQGTSVPEEGMGEVLQEALDELEYCMGDAEMTPMGKLRASHGHPEPFNIRFVEIGNEDWFSDTYPYRWEYMSKGLKAAYPNLTIISSTFNENAGYKIKLEPGQVWDTHHYEQPHYFLDNFNFYDNWQVTTNNTGVGVFLGEFSVFEVDTPSGSVNWSDTAGPTHVFYPRLLSAIAESVYALGGERNPGTVWFSSYAPSLQNLNWFNWTPNMITFTAKHSETVRSASYWWQWLFARYRGDETLKVVNTKGDFKPLYWAASIGNGDKEVYVKVVNSGNTTVPLTITLDMPFSSVNGTIISAPDVHAFNFVNNQTEVVPKPLALPASVAPNQTKFDWQVPAYSITVLQFQV